MSQTTIPTHAQFCECDLCAEDLPPVLDPRMNISPLARAALDAGVDVDDVFEYAANGTKQNAVKP